MHPNQRSSARPAATGREGLKRTKRSDDTYNADDAAQCASIWRAESGERATENENLLLSILLAARAPAKSWRSGCVACWPRS
eukprot:964553-Pleurochrysis_carterae.AAC.1